MVKINTKFEIGEMVRHKLQQDDDLKKVDFLIREIKIAICYAGIQIFYSCRPMVHVKRFSEGKQSCEVMGKDMHQYSEPELEKVND